MVQWNESPTINEAGHFVYGLQICPFIRPRVGPAADDLCLSSVTFEDRPSNRSAGEGRSPPALRNAALYTTVLVVNSFNHDFITRSPICYFWPRLWVSFLLHNSDTVYHLIWLAHKCNSVVHFRSICCSHCMKSQSAKPCGSKYCHSTCQYTIDFNSKFPWHLVSKNFMNALEFGTVFEILEGSLDFQMEADFNQHIIKVLKLPKSCHCHARMH